MSPISIWIYVLQLSTLRQTSSIQDKPAWHASICMSEWRWSVYLGRDLCSLRSFKEFKQQSCKAECRFMFNLEISRNINRILVTLCPVYVMYVKREVTRKYAGGWGCNVERAPPPIGSSHFAYSKEEQWWPEKCLSAYTWSSCWTGSWLPPELLESAWHFCDSSFAGQTSFSAAGCCPVQRGRLLCLSLQILEEWSMDASDGSQKIEILYLCGKASASLHL